MTQQPKPNSSSNNTNGKNPTPAELEALLAKYPKRRRPDVPHNLPRPVKLQIVEHISERVGQGEFLTRITEEENMPSPSTFRNWLRADTEFARLYADALIDRVEWYKARSVESAAESVPTYKDAHGNLRVDPAAVSAHNMRVRNLQWIATTLEARLRENQRSREGAIPSMLFHYLNKQQRDHSVQSGEYLPLLHFKEQYDLAHPPLD